jgi:Family of unknown function (DUF5317)
VVLADAIIILLILALLLRRDLSAVGRISYRGGWKFAAVVAGLFVLQAVTVLYVPGQTVFQIALLMLSQIALVFLLLLNRHVPGAKLFALGIMLNIAVMVANGGWMPVTPEIHNFVHPDRPVELQARQVNSKDVILPRAETNLWILSDIIPVTLPWRRNAVSIGDVLIILGAAQFIFQATSKQKDLAGPVDLGEPQTSTK